MKDFKKRIEKYLSQLENLLNSTSHSFSAAIVKYLKKFVNYCEINLKDKNKDRQLKESLRALVTILFAVVFGVGLSQLNEVSGIDQYLILSLAYVAVLLSWWGYHWGTIVGPSETNCINYFIDILLLVVYWYLIYTKESLSLILTLYVFMFLLYLLWETIRVFKVQRPLYEKEIIKKAIIVNSRFLGYVSIIYLSKNMTGKYINDLYYILILFVLIIGYRICITAVYKSNKYNIDPGQIQDDHLKRVIDVARKVATNARVHLSGFPVGAAILSNTGNIYSGCNVEFDNYSNTIHAEEAAISAFVSAGEKLPIKSIAIFTSGDKLNFPCGMCLQSLFELGGNDLKVIACNDIASETKTLVELLPSGFHL